MKSFESNVLRQNWERRLWWRWANCTVNIITIVLLLTVFVGSVYKQNKAVPARESLNLPKFRNRRKPQRRLNEEYNVNVLLHLSLEYANETLATQIETQDPSNDAVKHFCDAVNEQAGGNQVQFSAQEIGIDVETRIYGSIRDPDFQCKILSSSRHSDSNAEDIFGEGFFSLTVSVEQVVYIIADRIHSLGDVTSMVESGFNRGKGGRVRFRSLLQAHPMFTTVRNVEVLEGSLTRRPSLPPTAAPSFTPSEAPSVSPTTFPTQVLSQEPTESPSSISSLNPTLTEVPAYASTNTPTELPSHDELPSPTSPKPLQKHSSMADDELDPLTIAAIVGAVLIICFAFSCAFCMWYRPKRNSTAAQDEINLPYCGPILRSWKRRPGDVLHVSPKEIPGMVELDDGSLANTTLGEQTAGGFRRLPAPKKRFAVDVKRGPKLDSFDENSLYTTPFPLPSEPPAESNSNDGDSHYNMSSISILPPSIMPFEEENITFPDVDPADSVYSTSSESGAMQSSLLSQSYASSSLLSSTNRLAAPFDLDTAKPFNPSDIAFEFNDRLFRSNIERGQLSDKNKDESVSAAIIDEAERFSHFDDNEYTLSKCKVGELLQGGDSSFRSLDDSAVYSAASSALTKKVENMVILGFRAPPEEKSNGSPRHEEEKREIDFESRDDSSIHEIRRSPVSLDLLADHQLLERSDSPSSWSSWKVSQDGATMARAIKNSSDRNDQEECKKPDAREDVFASVASKTFLPVQDQQAKDSLPEEKEFQVDEIKESGTVQSDSKHGLVTSVSSGLSSAHEDGTGILGVRPRREASALDAGSVVSSSSGLSNPWLFDAVEQTLGPKSLTADMESLGGRSDRSVKSHRSAFSHKSANRSVKSIRSHRSYNASSRKRHKVRGDENIQSAVASVASYTGSSFDKKSAETTLTPRTLGHDLKRLESQLAALQTETDQVTASSITLSSIGARTRSTRSSRQTHTGAKFNRKRRVIVEVPSGKLGVILANRHDGKGTVVSEVKPDSALKGLLNPGDKLVAIDGEDVAGLTVTEITTIMTRKHDTERLLTVITSAFQENKSVGTL